MARALDGDREAFTRLVDRHAAPVWTAVARSLSDRELARDVFQETLLCAFEKLGSLADAGRLRSWLLAIALNLTRQALRRGEGRGTVELPELVAPRGTAEEAPERAELRAELSAAVSELSPRQREVVGLRIHFERSYAEIARELGISEESARASFYLATKRLRSRLADQEH